MRPLHVLKTALSPGSSKIAREGLPAGLYAYERHQNGGHLRAHLRIEADGYGFLLVNANRAYHFNPSGAMMAYHYLEQTPQEEAINAITQTFQVKKADARLDFAAFAVRLEELLSPDEVCPVCDLELDLLAPFSPRPSAPYRMDLALTYRCNNNCAHCYNARSRSTPELTTADWKSILDRLWDTGIPHIVFTGGEPTLRRDLPELIAHAQHNGQITGINTNGRQLKDAAFLNDLVSAGLDHVQITLESHDAEIHDQMVRAPGAWKDTVAGLQNALAAHLFVMTNTTLLQVNSSPDNLRKTLAFLNETGVPTVGLNALIYSGAGLEVGTGLPEQALPSLLMLAREMTTKNNQRLIWYTPTQYCHFDPMMLMLGIKGCTAALYNMCVEPEGSVIPCQSYYETVGNMLTDPWPAIWNHELSVRLRERQKLPDECQTCLVLPSCGGGCPLARQAGRSIPKAPVLPPSF